MDGYICICFGPAQACRDWSGVFREGTNGVGTNGVAANFMLFDRGTCWVLPLTYFSKNKAIFL